ncbi:MAG: ATP-binding protein [Desulfonatronovibrio sp. MSAO_Bac4]|nr:MAG: ATP-binding protein [Desulfonatronovibrio sp. MSAO_Bac4]
MYRHQLKFLDNWLKDENRKPLVIRGARQVGKSTLVQLFAKKYGNNLLNVNLERYPELSDIFNTKDPDQIIQQIEFLPGMKQANQNSLLFLDEIQAVPEAIPALRYFYEDKPRLPVLSAGSLLEFVLSDHSFSMPVGRIQYLHMGPMTFSEFLRGIGEDKLSAFILNYEPGQPIGEVIHKRLLGLLRSYYFVGGMPEAVSVFSKTKSYKQVRNVHNSIIETYLEDFPKYTGSRNLNRMRRVFHFIARNVGKKIKYSNISPEDQSSTLKRDIDLLSMARVIGKVTHSHCSGLPLHADIDDKVYKPLFLDIGLMNAIRGLDWRSVSQMDDVKLVNEGAIAEQFVGQHLQDMFSGTLNRESTYWLRQGRSANAELDFVIQSGGHMVPIEVKAGAAGSLKSLHQFMGSKEAPLAVRVDASLPSLSSIDTIISTGKTRKQVKYTLVSIPLYLIERLRIIEAHYSHDTPS